MKNLTIDKLLTEIKSRNSSHEKQKSMNSELKQRTNSQPDLLQDSFADNKSKKAKVTRTIPTETLLNFIRRSRYPSMNDQQQSQQKFNKQFSGHQQANSKFASQQIFQNNYFKISCTSQFEEIPDEQLRNSKMQSQSQQIFQHNAFLLEKVKKQNKEIINLKSQVQQLHTQIELLNQKLHNQEVHNTQRMKSIQLVLQQKQKDFDLLCKTHSKEIQMKNDLIKRLHKKIEGLGEISLYPINQASEVSLSETSMMAETATSKFVLYQLQEINQMLETGQSAGQSLSDSRNLEMVGNHSKRIFYFIDQIKKAVLVKNESKKSKFFSSPKQISMLQSPNISQDIQEQANITLKQLKEQQQLDQQQISELRLALKSSQQDLTSQEEQLKQYKIKLKALYVKYKQLIALFKELEFIKSFGTEYFVQFRQHIQTILLHSLQGQQKLVVSQVLEQKQQEFLQLKGQYITKELQYQFKIKNLEEMLEQLKTKNFEILVEKEKDFQNEKDQLVQQQELEIKKIQAGLAEELAKERKNKEELESIVLKYEEENANQKQIIHEENERHQDEMEKMIQNIQDLVQTKNGLESKLARSDDYTDKLNEMVLSIKDNNDSPDIIPEFKDDISSIINKTEDDLYNQVQLLQMANIQLNQNNEELKEELIERELNEDKLMNKIKLLNTGKEKERENVDSLINSLRTKNEKKFISVLSLLIQSYGNNNDDKVLLEQIIKSIKFQSAKHFRLFN